MSTFSNFAKQGFCSCDRRCRILGDCCGDAPRECFGARNNHLSNLLPNDEGDMFEFESIRSNVLPIRTKYIYIESEKTPYGVYYSFVSGCSDSALYQQECIYNFMLETVAHYIPVCHHHSGLFFLNRFCAACNGYRMEETFSFYTHFELCENWIALNYSVDELFESSTGVDELQFLCLHTSVLEIPNACDATAERRRIYDPVVVNDQEKISLCTGFANPVVSKNNLGQAVIMKNQFCLQNTSAPWHCYDGKVRPYTKDADISNETVVVWVNKFGDTVVSPPNSGYDDTEIDIGGTSWIHSPASISLALLFFVFRYIYFDNWGS